MSIDRDLNMSIRAFLEEQDEIEFRGKSNRSNCIDEATTWIRDTARPAFGDLANILIQSNRNVTIYPEQSRGHRRARARAPQARPLDYSIVEVQVTSREGDIEFQYRLHVDCSQPGMQIKKSISSSLENSPRAGLQDADFRPLAKKVAINEVAQRDLIEDFFEDYKARLIQRRR